MPSGRPPKAKLNEVVEINETGEYATIVDYRRNVKWGRYLAIRTDGIGRYAHGQAFWLDTTEFTRTGKISRRPGITYRANQRTGGDEMRGCVCQCCVHIRGFEEETE